MIIKIGIYLFFFTLAPYFSGEYGSVLSGLLYEFVSVTGSSSASHDTLDSLGFSDHVELEGIESNKESSGLVVET